MSVDYAAASKGRTGPASFAGVGTLIWLGLKRDRIKLPAWILGIAVFVPYFAFVTAKIYPTPADMLQVTEILKTPFGAFFSGPGYGMEDINAVRMLVSAYGLEFLIGAAIMNLLLMARQLRADEEGARGELLRAGAVARHAPLTAGLLIAVIANLILALLVTAFTMALGNAVWSSLLFGTGVGAAGLSFAALTAITCQLAERASGGALLGAALLTIAVIIRGIGDMLVLHGHWLSWLSPIAWSQQTRAFVDDRWWPLLLSLVLFVAASSIAYLLHNRRDYGAGLLAALPGRRTAPDWLNTTAALAWRLRRRSIITWYIAIVLAGLVYGGLGSSMADSLDDFDLPEAFLGTAGMFGTDLYLSLMSTLFSIITGVHVVLSVSGLSKNEQIGLTTPILATSVRRSSYFAVNMGLSLLSALTLLALAGAAMGLTMAISKADATLLPVSIGALLTRFPEVAALAGIAAALYGLRPSLHYLAWISLIYGVILTYFVPDRLGITEWLQIGSPYGVIDRMPPFDQFNLTAWLGLLALGLILTIVGMIGFTHRDLSEN